MEPAKNIVEKFGGTKALADALGIQTSAVLKWTYPKERSGTNGLIPTQKQIEIIAAAKRLGVKLSPKDFFPAGIFDKK